MFLWALAEPGRIPEAKRGAIESPANIVYVSSVSVAELMIKASLGKLEVDFDLAEEISSAGFEPLDFSVHDALRLKSLPFHHWDPFDRMLISQSMERRIPILTLDTAFRLYECRLV